MIDELAKIYEDKVILVENDKSGTVQGSKPVVGKGFEGEEKVKKDTSGTGDAKKPSIKKPVEAKIDENKEKQIMLPNSQFDKLFKSSLIAEAGEESPLEKTGAGEFNDDQGDFNPTGEAGETGEGASEEEEVDVATELRMIIDRLTDLAEKLGAYSGAEGEEGAMGGEGDIGAEGGEGAMGGEGMPKPVPESHVMDITKDLPDAKAKMQSKGNMKVKSEMDPSSEKADEGGPGKGEADGKLKSQPKSKFGPTMKMTADASKVVNKKGSDLF